MEDAGTRLAAADASWVRENLKSVLPRHGDQRHARPVAGAHRERRRRRYDDDDGEADGRGFCIISIETRLLSKRKPFSAASTCRRLCRVGPGNFTLSPRIAAVLTNSALC